MGREDTIKEVDCDIIKKYCQDKYYCVNFCDAELCGQKIVYMKGIVERCIAKKEIYACRFISEFLKAQEQKDLQAVQEKHQDLRDAIERIIATTPRDDSFVDHR